jgi:trans-aconitate methyltransferase
MDAQTNLNTNDSHNRDLWNRWRRIEYEDISTYTTAKSSSILQELEHAALRQCMIARLRRVTSQVRFQRAVDLGCATGDWTLAYTAFCDQVVGIDINDSFITHAKGKAAGLVSANRLKFGTMNLIDFDGYRNVDLVCLGACLSLIDDHSLDTLFTRITRDMSKGGYIYVRVAVTSPRRQSYATQKGYYRTRETYERLFRRHGLCMLDTTGSIAVVVSELLREARLIDNTACKDETVKSTIHRTLFMKRLLDGRNNYLNWILRLPG